MLAALFQNCHRLSHTNNFTVSLPLSVLLCERSQHRADFLIAMEDHSGFPSRADLLTALQACSPHSTPITNESLNELLRLIGPQKGSGFSEVDARTMDSSHSTLDSARFQPLDRNIHLPAISRSGTPATLQSSPLGPSNASRIAYSSDAISSGHATLLNQVSKSQRVFLSVHCANLSVYAGKILHPPPCNT